MPFREQVEVPNVSYARSGEVWIAYQLVGSGPDDLVLLPFLSNLYTLWQAPKFAEFAYGSHVLKGVPGNWNLYAVAES